MAKNEKNLKERISYYIKEGYAYSCLAKLNDKTESKIKYIENEGDAYIDAMNLSTCPEEQKILLGFAIRTYLRAAIEANNIHLYELEEKLYLKVEKIENNDEAKNILIDCAGHSSLKNQNIYLNIYQKNSENYIDIIANKYKLYEKKTINMYNKKISKLI